MGDYYFFYGSLIFPQVLRRVLAAGQAVAGRESDTLNFEQFTPAILKGYSRKKVLGADYPAIVSSENQHEVYGVLVQGLSRIEIEQLDKWEGDQYIRKNVEVYIRKLPPSNGNHPEYQSSKPEATQLFSNEDYEAISKSTNSLLVSAQTYVWIDSPAFLKDEDWEPEEFLKNLVRWESKDYET